MFLWCEKIINSSLGKKTVLMMQKKILFCLLASLMDNIQIFHLSAFPLEFLVKSRKHNVDTLAQNCYKLPINKTQAGMTFINLSNEACHLPCTEKSI